MVRPSSLLHPQRPIVPARRAATLLLLRDTEAGLEVLMTRRAHNARFAPGVYVFPGGVEDPADREDGDDRDAATQPAPSDRATPAHAPATAARLTDPDRRTARRVALRETFEELGILLARDAAGDPVAAQAVAGLDRSGDLPAQLRARRWSLPLDALADLAVWITDRDMSRRYDVAFLMARMPADQQPQPDNQEQFEPCWVRPADALAEHARDRFPMIFPTVRTLQRLLHWPTVQAALDACADGPLWTSCPRGGWMAGAEMRFEETDAPFGELELVSPDGQLVHNLDWQSAQPVPLLRHLWRLTAPNGGMMTGPGTNTYIVGDRAGGFAVIDPGPADDRHIDRIIALLAAPEGALPLKYIICTHSHPDHAPGALRLAERTGVPVLGLSSGPGARPHSRFRPHRELQDGERLELGCGTLEVVFTPGHAANHICLWMPEDRLLFSGDHILNGSTTVIDPPDGDMAAYLDSLERLARLDADFILPAHGYVLGAPNTAIARLIGHRLKREADVLLAVHTHPGQNEGALVPHVYRQLPAALHPMAARSLLAHLLKLTTEARVVNRSGAWWVVEGPPSALG